MQIVIDIDRASPFLAFNIAFSFCSFGVTPGPREHRIQVWHVDLVLDEQQLGVGLTCKHVATFPLETDIYFLNDLSLLGPHVAFSVGIEKSASHLRSLASRLIASDLKFSQVTRK
jgi:hypothetical protein